MQMLSLSDEQASARSGVREHKVYRITHVPSGKCYIGVTRQTVQTRWKRHVRSARTGGYGVFWQAIREFGPKAFAVEHIASANSLPDVNATERMIIAQDGTRVPNGFNVSLGGGGPGPFTDEMRLRMSRARTGMRHSDETRALISRLTIAGCSTPKEKARRSLASSGRKMSDEAKSKIAEAKRGTKQSPEHIEALRATRVGRTRTDEQKRKTSATLRQTFASQAMRDKLSQAQTGRKHSEESILKHSGSKNPKAILNEDAVAQIFALREAGGRHAAIAAMFSVSRPTISAVLSGRNWRRAGDAATLSASR